MTQADIDPARGSTTTLEMSGGSNEPAVRINLERGQRGGYGWSVTVRGDDSDAVLVELDSIDRWLRRRYLEEEA